MHSQFCSEFESVLHCIGDSVRLDEMRRHKAVKSLTREVNMLWGSNVQLTAQGVEVQGRLRAVRPALLLVQQKLKALKAEQTALQKRWRKETHSAADMVHHPFEQRLTLCAPAPAHPPRLLPCCRCPAWPVSSRSCVCA